VNPTSTGHDFESAALPHLDQLFRTAVRVLRDRTDAEDIVQETYFQALRSFHRFEPGTNCKAWLFKIMFHVIHHHRRKAYRQSMRLAGETERPLEELAVYEPPVPRDLADEEVLAALDRVPVHYRAVVLLVDVEELAYKEAAAALGLPIGTVMSRLSRGRKFLRTELGQFAEGYGIGLTVNVEGVRL
jgi:RNA polymerase sigma-70 factor (ECF subfamily)